MSNKRVDIVGGGLAGVEAANILSLAGYSVRIFEMRPLTTTPVHNTDYLGEIVCSNSLKSEDPLTSKGLLKKEMDLLGSLVLSIARRCSVPAGRSLNIDRNEFGKMITQDLEKRSNISIIRGEASDIPPGENVIIATGPLTSDRMAESIIRYTGSQSLHFFDAVSPIINTDSIDEGRSFRGLRYGKGEGELLNFPMNKEEYRTFYDALVAAERIQNHEADDKVFFEACLPVEEIAARGADALRFGPLRPVGFKEYIKDRPYAVVQARPENSMFDSVELIGFQTRLKFPEQKRVLRLIPGLEHARFLRYGVMHRNTFIDSPVLLEKGLRLKSETERNLLFAGQITGVEGYIESAVSGILSGYAMIQLIESSDFEMPPVPTMCGALMSYIATPAAPKKGFQPMGANFGLLDGSCYRKSERRQRQMEDSLNAMGKYIEKLKKILGPSFPVSRKSGGSHG